VTCQRVSEVSSRWSVIFNIISTITRNDRSTSRTSYIESISLSHTTTVRLDHSLQPPRWKRRYWSYRDGKIRKHAAFSFPEKKKKGKENKHWETKCRQVSRFCDFISSLESNFIFARDGQRASHDTSVIPRFSHAVHHKTKMIRLRRLRGVTLTGTVGAGDLSRKKLSMTETRRYSPWCYSRRTLFALKCDCARSYHWTSIKLTALSRPGKLSSASSTRPIVRLPRHLIGLSIIAQSSRPNFSFALSLSLSLFPFQARAKRRMEDKM